MPTYSNPLYANGVPTYSNEVGALGEVFKALAPNPLRDLQIQGYASNARLHQLQGDVIQDKRAGASRAADIFATNPQGAMVEAIRSDNPEMMGAFSKFNPAYYAANAITGGPVDQGRLATLVVGGGGDYGNTVPGFTANQDRQTQEANQKNDTERYGIGVRSADSRYGSNLQASVGFDRNRRYSTAEANTLGETTRYHNMQNATQLDKNDVDYDVGMDRNAKGLEGTQFTSNNTLKGTQYTADRNLEGKKFDTLNDQRKTTAGAGATVDPAKFDEAMLQSVPGSFKDEKGHWNTDASVTPADLAEVRTRAAFYLRQDPRDQYGAIQRSVAEVFGNAPTMTPADEPWLGTNTPAQVQSLPAAQRPPLPNLAQQFAAPQAAPAPLPEAAPAAPSAPTADANLAKAAAAAKIPGANRQGIIQKLMANGYTAAQIQQAGI